MTPSAMRRIARAAGACLRALAEGAARQGRALDVNAVDVDGGTALDRHEATICGSDGLSTARHRAGDFGQLFQRVASDYITG